MKIAFFAFFMVAAITADGGTVLKRSNGAILSIDGHSYRLDLPESKEPRAHDAIVSSDGDKTATYLNQGNRTWFQRGSDSVGATSLRFGIPLLAKVEKHHVEWHDEPAEPIAGHPATKRVLRINYSLIHDMSGTLIRSKVSAIILLTATADLPPVVQPDIRTRFPEIDRELSAALSSMAGLLVAQALTVTQTYDGGKPFTDVQSWTTDSIVEKPLPASMFKVPQGFVHQLPQVGTMEMQHANR
ncbi:MAG TPA: hypothetical protein VHL58_00445 [Thermoanaerobaculia bacterium]|nr:hypothetical protein [Thermoanaerobaculia bacterium]